jgi:hypothetical protein
MKVLFLSIFVSGLLVAGSCYQYKPNALRAILQNKAVTKPSKIIVKMPDTFKKRNNIVKLLARVNGKNFIHKWLLCTLHSNTINCSGECDSASLTFSKNYALKINFIDFAKEQKNQEPILELSIKGKPSVWMQPKKVACPSLLANKKKSKAKLYVCYARRVGVVKPKYYGCFRSEVSCNSIGKKHFGHYPSQRSAKRALHRCVTSKPRFVD